MDLGAKLTFLARADTYRDGTAAVDVIETHLSWVFLTERRALKLKKPVRTSYLDHRSVASRRRVCEEEVRLNRRLAPDVYLGVVSLRCDRGALSLGGVGEIVDWLVVMRRLPADRMLSALIARGEAEPGHIDAVADVLIGFYRRADRCRWDAARYWRWLRTSVTSTAGELVARGADASRVARLTAAQLSTLERGRDALEARVDGGHVVDAHGDLRPEHICLESPPVIIDCLEFDDDLRMLDAASELSFLALECERLGAPELGARLLAHYRVVTGDDLDPALLALYRSQHACVRALIAARHLDDAPDGDGARWSAKVGEYLRLAGELA